MKHASGPLIAVVARESFLDRRAKLLLTRLTTDGEAREPPRSAFLALGNC
jgi:hypothetical protein